MEFTLWMWKANGPVVEFIFSDLKSSIQMRQSCRVFSSPLLTLHQPQFILVLLPVDSLFLTHPSIRAQYTKYL